MPPSVVGMCGFRCTKLTTGGRTDARADAEDTEEEEQLRRAEGAATPEEEQGACARGLAVTNQPWSVCPWEA